MKRKGRPPLPEGMKKTVNLTMRLQPALYECLRLCAEANGRSISSEAEQRLKADLVLLGPEEYGPIIKNIIELYGH